MGNIPGMQDSGDQNEVQIEIPDLLKFLLSSSSGKGPLLSNTIPSATDEIMLINMSLSTPTSPRMLLHLTAIVNSFSLTPLQAE